MCTDCSSSHLGGLTPAPPKPDTPDTHPLSHQTPPPDQTPISLLRKELKKETPVNRIIHACENITFPLRYAVGDINNSNYQRSYKECNCDSYTVMETATKTSTTTKAQTGWMAKGGLMNTGISVTNPNNRSLMELIDTLWTFIDLMKQNPPI